MFSTQRAISSMKRLTLVVGLLIFILSGTTEATYLADENDPKPVAQVLAVITVDDNGNDQIKEKASSSEITITRGPGGCPPADVVRKGVLLCAGDRVKTSGNWKLKIAFGDPKDRDEVTLSRNSEVTISSIWCLGLCRWFASLNKPTANQTQHAVFVNTSTVYEVETFPDESAVLFVYEGKVSVSPKGAEPSSGTTPEVAPPTAPITPPVEVAPPVVQPSPATTPAEVTPPVVQPSPGATPVEVTPPIVEPSPAATPVEAPPTGTLVPSLFKATINIDGTIRRLEKMDAVDVCRKLEFSAQAEIAIHKTPAEAGGNVAKFVNFDTAERNDLFGRARCDSYLLPDQPYSYEIVGMIYNDWGDAEKALENFSKAAALYVKNGIRSTKRDVPLNKAIALRQTKKYADALSEVEALLSDPLATTFVGDALNVRGNVYYDQAREALNADQTAVGIAQARDLLEKANAAYQEAETKGGPTLQYVRVNRGQVSKAQGDIFLREKKYPEAERSYISAIETLRETANQRGNPLRKFAGLLMARALASLAATYAVMEGKNQMSKDFYTKAEGAYLLSISNAPESALAYCGLASLYQIQGDPKARQNYDKCLTYNIAALVTEVDVPNVIGLSRAAAIQALAEAGLEAEIEIDGETVQTQEPAVGRAKVGAKIKISLPNETTERD